MSDIDAIIDTISSFMGVMFGLNYFLAFGLEIPIFKHTAMPTLMTSFGIASPAEPFDFSSSMLSVFGGCWALPNCFANISGLTGNESDDAKTARQFGNLGSWLAWSVGYGVWSFNGGQGGFFGSAFNIQWNIMFAAMLFFHLKWFGGPAGVLKKIKGD